MSKPTGIVNVIANTLLILQNLNLCDHMQQVFILGALVHDIGKLEIDFYLTVSDNHTRFMT